MASIAETLFPDVLPYPETPIPYSPSGYADYKNPLYKLPPPPSLGNYALLLAENKAKLLRAMRACGLSQENQFLLMAMAMQETETLSEGERDSTKDKGDALAVNFSIFNLGGFFLRMAGATGDYKRLNPHKGLQEVVQDHPRTVFRADNPEKKKVLDPANPKASLDRRRSRLPR